jgi:hypothetical protein
MSNLLATDIEFLDDLLQMQAGYVLDFTSRNFTGFFAGLGIDIDDPAYVRHCRSKAKRLRCFLQAADKSAVVQVLDALWRYRESGGQTAEGSEATAASHRRVQALVARLQADSPDPTVNSDAPVGPTLSPSALARLSTPSCTLDSVSAETQAPPEPMAAPTTHGLHGASLAAHRHEC